MNDNLFLEGRIKLEEHYPLDQSNENVFLNHCITTFYGNDSSEDIIHAKVSAQEVISILDETIDLCDTPLNEILKYVINHPDFKGVDIDLVKSKIIRQKNLLKRLRAKKRPYRAPQIEIQVEEQSGNDDEFKKKRNRVSAQISRDRKKQKNHELQKLNGELREELQKVSSQNEKLRAELEKIRIIQAKPQLETSSRFMKLTVFLGVIFLLSLIRDSARPAADLFLPAKLAPFQETIAKTTFDATLPSFDAVPSDLFEPLREALGKGEIAQRVQTSVQLHKAVWNNFRNENIPQRLKNYIQEANNYVVN